MELAQAFVRLRVDSKQVQTDTEKGLKTASTGTAAKKAGEDTGKHFGSGFSSSLRGALAGGAALLGVAGAVEGLKSIVEEGTKLQKSTVLLTAAEKAHGLSVKANNPIIEDAVKQGNKYGVTQDIIQTGLTKLINAGVPLKEALQVQQAALSVSAVTGQDYASVLQKLTQGGGTAARTLKALGVTQVTGATQAKANASAAALLNSRIQESGGLAKFAAANHISLAKAHELVTGALHGNIGDYNKLNIEVLPKSATLAQNLAQAQGILNAKYGKEGTAATKTFAGQQKQLVATLKDTAATIGVKVLPFLTTMVQWLSRTVSWLTGGSISAKIFIGALLGFGAVYGLIKSVKFVMEGLAAAQKLVTGAGAVARFVVWFAAQAAGLITTAALWVMYTLGVESAGVATVIATGGIILIIGALIAAAFLLIKNWRPIWAAIRAAAEAVVRWFLGSVIPFFTKTLPHAFFVVIDWVRKNWPLLVAILFGPIAIAVALITTHWNLVERVTVAIFTAIGRFFLKWWTDERNFVGQVIGVIVRLLSDSWQAIWRTIVSVFTTIGRFFLKWWGDEKSFVTGVVGAIGKALGAAWTGIYHGVQSAFGTIGGFFAKWWGDTERFFGTAVDKISSRIATVWKSIVDLTRILWTAIGNFMSAGINAGKRALHDAIAGVEGLLKPLVHGYNAVRTIWKGANVVFGALGFAQGGKVTHGTTDTADDVVVRVSKNETILSAAHSRMLDHAGVLGAIGVPGYKYGGDPGDPRTAPPWVKRLNRNEQAAMFHAMGVYGYAAGGAVTGPQIASDAERWNGHRYVWGGASNPKTGWDCSSFAGYILGHDFGFALPGGVHWNANTHGPTANMFTGQPGFGLVSHNIMDIQAGDLLVENSGGHVGFGVGPNKMFSAYDTQSGTIFSNAQNMTEILRIHQGVRLGAGALPGSGPGGGGSLTAKQIADFKAYMALVNSDIKLYSGEAIARQFELNPGSLPKGVLTPKGVSGYTPMAGHVASQIKPAVQALYDAAAAAAAATGSGPAGVGGSAGEMANGKQIYNYLLQNLFGGHKIAAAGATASIWGESTWNPFAQGSGGRGLIGWTPASTISDADFRGGMATQLPAILRFVTSSGDSSTIASMFNASSILQAANEWGHGVERFGINDVHSAGLGLAKQIAGLSAGGMITEPIRGIGASGQRYALGEGGRRERVHPAGNDPMLDVLMRIAATLDRAPAATAAGVARAVTSPAAGMSQAARVGAR